ncbi:MAG: phosphate/phosphite/phosphonate ABC transporter substrate-binding protein [Methyloprofundus sp.]|nr:phosphate/phosphite/phosphonate ABC transporter substrate-binding protein [Methyloprofundus sp.]
MRLAITLLLALLSFGCEKPHEPATEKTPQTPCLVFAVPPYEMPSNIEQRFNPLLAFLTQQLGQPVRLHISASYEDQVKRLAEGDVDLAYMGPSSYIKSRDNFNQGKPILIAAEAPYRAVLIVHKNSDIQSVSQLKNHSLAFGSYHSYSGHYVVRQRLRLQNVFLRDLQFYSFLGRHERAIMSVVHRDFDAAATTEGLAHRFIELGYPIRIIERSELLAPTVIVAKPGTDAALVNKIREALLFSKQENLGFALFEVDDNQFKEVERIVFAIEY